MKPDAYMPLFFNDFFQAVAGQPDGVIVAYMRALGHYWQHCACAGLRNDDGYLRSICQRFDDWPTVKPIVFGEYFRLDAAGLWQQKRARKEWEKSSEVFQSRSQAGKKAISVRWSKHTPRNT